MSLRKIKKAVEQMESELSRSMRESGFFCSRPNDDELNKANRNVIWVMTEYYSGVFLGKFDYPLLRKYPDDNPLYNHSCHFVVPTHDKELIQLIQDNEGIANNQAIAKRVEEIKGHHLVWS